MSRKWFGVPSLSTLEPRRVLWELEGLEVVLDAARAAVVRVALVLHRRAGPCKLQDHVVGPRLAEFWLVGADRTHDGVEVEKAGRYHLALKGAVATHAGRGREERVSGADDAALLRVAALDEVLHNDTAVAPLLKSNAQRLVELHLVAVLWQLEQGRVGIAVLLRVLLYEVDPAAVVRAEALSKLHGGRQRPAGCRIASAESCLDGRG
mmetsp:Transcript_36094/g.116209  ORF Transcript_36094/g.116209 Transcript_36094/m.116209 type:complete len:208 (+) Transcript_36094:228-851(+)